MVWEICGGCVRGRWMATEVEERDNKERYHWSRKEREWKECKEMDGGTE